ncbi:N-acetylglucosamine kinase [Actinocatenispora rupis]|uniref:ATPase BadF/BadG/BcrA/BcrD type domain-containing protein n=1 Tax=Actinocatenispora rupis TaxID=519421 RepID=A0A8J3J7N2_9ACTN|nr:BadF/BadG/BcrA/BcrD ATPase family protein [Actinocatenispora rupis]GID10903.1 hypothetical protein Aru02nite_17920 [Actinocatenispora rupis]
MTERVDVAVDAGQTGVRLALARGGRPVAQVSGPGLRYGHGDGPARAVLDAFGALRAGLPPDGPVGTVCVGLTSVLGADGEYESLAAGLLERFAADRVVLTGDVVTAHAGALGARPGVVLAAGTGAIALGVRADGRHRQVDGWGHLYGDAGGGFWIGRHGLDAAMRGHDGRAPAGALRARAAAVFGNLGDLAERLYPDGDAVARIAAFARDVLELAEVDAVAAEIADRAAAELAGTVTAAGAAGSDVSWTGRLLGDDGLRRRFAAALADRAPTARLRTPDADGLTGAACLAAADDLAPYAGLCRVRTR